MPEFRRLIGRQINELVEIGGRFLDAPEFEIFFSPMVIGQRTSRIECQRLIEVLDRLLRLPNLGVETAPHVIGLGVLRLGLNGFCRQFNRVFALSLGKRNASLGQQFISALLRGACQERCEEYNYTKGE